MKRINLNLLIFVLFTCGAFVIKGRSAKVERLPTSITEQKAPAQVLSIVNNPSTVRVAVAPVLRQTPKIEAKVVQPFAKELARYSELKKKVFLNGKEATAKEQILKNEKVLRGMGARLNHSPTDSKEAIEQNAAIDLLVEALRSGDNEVATEVLRSVVTDGSIEDESLESSELENLAGVKA